LAWIKEAEKRGDVDWRQIKELHDAWDYQSSGLGAGAALIIAIVVTVLTAGAASAAIGAMAGATAGSGSAMAAGLGTAAAGFGNVAATAVVTSAASTAAVSTINNKGNLGNVFKDITSANNLKNYVTAGVTAGVIAGVVDPVLSVKTDPTNGTIKGFDLSTASGIAGITQHAAATAVVQAGVGTAINGSSFSDNLQGALKNQLQSVLQAVAFNAVGDYSHDKWDDSSPQKVALHALVGGLLSKAAGNDFATGAAAAGANELLIKQLDALTNSNPELLVAASQIVGVAAAGLTNGDAQMGADIAKSATSYNYLNHKEVEELGEALVGCRTAANPESCRNDAVQHFKEISDQKTNLALNGCRDTGESGCSNQRLDIENATDLLDGLITLGGYSQAERDILQDFSDSNFHDWQLGQNLWLKEFLKESGVVGGALVGGGLATGTGHLGEKLSSSTNEQLLRMAAQPLNEGQLISRAGRAVTKHPEYFGFGSTQELRQVYRSDLQLNNLAEETIKEILKSGIKATGAGGRYPQGWITYSLPDGRSASWKRSGEFIGFRGNKK
ncbi:MAG: DUF637 domain-containing protein, partial [Pseudomonas sp.]|uniref:DUF637 domain-containing protein n=1 Tax=Pseudomonas sp. TaxID=306 RepID=UPI0030F0CCA3